MDSLNTIPNSGSFGDVSAKLNDNFSKVGQSLTTLKNVAIANKGYFDTLASLQAAFPSPKAGNIAYVANVASSTGYYIYNVVSGVWTATTTEAPAVGVAISNYAQHGYSSSPKTLKQVEDDLVQLAGDTSNYIQSYVVVDFANKKLSLSNGYIYTRTFTKSIKAQEITFTDDNSVYVYLNVNDFTFYAKKYYEAKLNLNDLKVAFINQVYKTVDINASSLTIDDRRVLNFYDKNLKSIEDLTLQVMNLLPNSNWLDKTYNSEAQIGFVFLDKRCIVSNNNKLNGVDLIANKAGDIKISLYNTSNLTVASSQIFSCVVGINKLKYTEIIDYGLESYYVAIEGITGTVKLIYPSDNNIYGAQISNASLISNGYSFAYVIYVIKNESLAARVSSIESIISITSGDDINKMLADKDDIQLEGREYIINEPIILRSGKSITGVFGKTKLKLASGLTDLFVGNSVEDIKLSNFELVGNQGNYVYDMNGIVENASYNSIITEEDALTFTYYINENAINVNIGERIIIENIVIRNFKGSGLKIQKVGKDYIWGLKANNLFISNCYNGIQTDNEHEFSNYNNISITLCQIGAIIRTGNLMFSNSHFTRCRAGVIINEGLNHAHGQFTGIQIKHHQLFGLLFNNITNGQSVNSLSMAYGALKINNSKGISIDGLELMNSQLICVTGSTGGNNQITGLKNWGVALADVVGNITIKNQFNPI